MTFTERRQRLTDTESELVLLEIVSPAFSEPLRAANDTRDWTSNGTHYVGVTFGFTLPDDVAGPSARAQLEMVNVGTGLTDELERWQPGQPIMATLLITDKANPDVIERRIPLPMEGVTVTTGRVTARLGVDSIDRQQAVRVRFTPFLAPGAFAQ